MDAKFMAHVEQEAEKERAAHTVFDVEQQRHREAAATENESDDDYEFDWNGADPQEKAAEQGALVESFETLKKAENAANETLQHQLLEDAAAHRALATTRRMEQRAVQKLMRREGGNNGALRPSTAPRGDK
jgi:hypothetical protein